VNLKYSKNSRGFLLFFGGNIARFLAFLGFLIYTKKFAGKIIVNTE
jgi:hypothetical protein